MDEGPIRVFKLIAGLLIVYGVATVIIVVVAKPDPVIITAILRSYSAMFAGFLGLVAGFLAGRR
jgi:hypothetical protein